MTRSPMGARPRLCLLRNLAVYPWGLCAGRSKGLEKDADGDVSRN